MPPMSDTLQAEPSAVPYEFRVQNMDCAACASRVEGTLTRLVGVSDVQVNFTTQRLRLRVNEALTSRSSVERILTELGYPPELSTAARSSTVTEHYPAPPAWYRTFKGRLVLTTGVLLVISVLLALAQPSLAQWGFAAATVLGVAPLVRNAWVSTRLGQPFTINTLIVVAAVGAVLIGEAAEGALVVFLFAVGELLETVAAGRARAGIRSLAALAPKKAFLLEADAVREVPVEMLAPGDLVRVQPGGRVPADGVITSGAGGVDESPVTGESIPVFKGEGDPVFAGSISSDAVLELRVERPVSDSTISRIIQLVEEAESNKAPTARFIDRFSSWYTPAAMLMAALVAVVPPLLFAGSWETWIYRALALLLIACPCALVLSVPAAVTSGISAATRRGLLIKGGSVLEALADVQTVAFDKTGTLTRNRPEVTDTVALHGTEEDVLRLAAAVETGSAHPLARAILQAAEGLELPPVDAARAIPGEAVTARIGGSEFAVGSPRFAGRHTQLTEALNDRITNLEAQGKTVVVLLRDNVPLGLIAIRDEPRADAAETVRRLAAMNVRSVMLTGDNDRTGQAVAETIGLPARTELLPEDKLAAIDELRIEGKVAMVGDGINDAPALAHADVGIAMGGGTDVALETAGAALLRQNTTGVSDLIELSRTTMRNIRQNITFALGLKAVFLVTTLTGITGLWPAILSDTGATVLVTANALRLLRFEPTQRSALPPAAKEYA